MQQTQAIIYILSHDYKDLCQQILLTCHKGYGLISCLCLTVAGREGNRKRNTNLASTSNTGADIWTEESCMLKRRFNHCSSLCSTSEDAVTLDSRENSSIHLRLFQRIVLWRGKWPWGWLLCEVIFLLWMLIHVLKEFHKSLKTVHNCFTDWGLLGYKT